MQIRPTVLTIQIPRTSCNELPPALPTGGDDILDEAPGSPAPSDGPDKTHTFRTEQDSYGVSREYTYGIPTITPDQQHPLSDVSDSPYLALNPSPGKIAQHRTVLENVKNTAANFYAPFRNASIFRLMSWFYGPSITNSISNLNSLVKDVLLAPDFKPEDLVGFNAVKENALMDKFRESSSSSNTPLATPFAFDDTWIKGAVELPLPCDGFKLSESEAPKFQGRVPLSQDYAGSPSGSRGAKCRKVPHNSIQGILETVT